MVNEAVVNGAAVNEAAVNGAAVSEAAVSEAAVNEAAVNEAAANELVGRLVRAHAPALYLRFDAEDRVLEANTLTEELFGRDPRGLQFAELVVTFERHLSPSALAASPERRVPLNFLAFTGLPQTFSCSFARLGETTVLVGGTEPREQEQLRRDLLQIGQERASAIRSLQRTLADLAELGRMRDRFIGMAAHDLRSPIHAILIWGELLADELADVLEPEQREDLESLRGAAKLMRSIVEGFLDAALLDAGELRLERTLVTPAALVAGALPMVRAAARRKQVTVTVACEESLPPISVDAPKLQQVLINLGNNAVQHSRPGSDVRVSVVLYGETLVVAVHDSGVGIPPELQANLFSAYAGGLSPKTSGERSIGLGLAITRMIVEAHGGRIEADSAPERGTTFTVSLPGRAGAQAAR